MEGNIVPTEPGQYVPRLALVNYADAASTLPLPTPIAPSTGPISPALADEQTVVALDASLSRDPALVNALVQRLQTTEISFITPLEDSVPSVTSTGVYNQLLQAVLNSCGPANAIFNYQVLDHGPHEPVQDMGISPSSYYVPPDDVSIDRVASAPSDKTVKASVTSKPNASRKRKHADAADVAGEVLAPPDPQAVADALAQQMEQLACEAESARQAQAEEPDPAINEQDANMQLAIFSIAGLRQLQAVLLHAKLEGHMSRVPQPILLRLLGLLELQQRAGRNVTISEDTENAQETLPAAQLALEACITSLYILSSPGMPGILYGEEAMEVSLWLLNYHLQKNALALYDARFKKIHRPDEYEDGPVALTKSGKPSKAKKTWAAAQLPGFAPGHLGRLEVACKLLVEVLARVRISPAHVLALLRSALQTLSVETMQRFHVCAAELAVTFFRFNPEHRGYILEEVVSGALTNMAAGKHVPRNLMVQDNPRVSIQASVGLAVQLVQASATLPPLDATTHVLRKTLAEPMHWATHFWHLLFQRLPDAKTTKADTAQDIKLWMDAALKDLIELLHMPEWPAATLMLRRLVVLLQHGDAGLRHSDAGVRGASVELLGALVEHLCRVCKAAEHVTTDTHTMLMQLLEREGIKPEPDANGGLPHEVTELAQQLLLEHLAGVPEAGVSALSTSGVMLAAGSSTAVGAQFLPHARELIVCNMLAAQVKRLDCVKELKGKRVPDEALRFRQILDRQRSCLGTSTSSTALPALERGAAAQMCGLLLTDSPLSRVRPSLIGWLVEAAAGGGVAAKSRAAGVLDTPLQALAATSRAKAIRLLGAAIDQDVLVLSLPEVQRGVTAALGDDSIMVREAALELIGKYLGRHPGLAEQYYSVLVKSMEDPGVSVRKRAIRLLWECCVRGSAPAAAPAPAAAAVPGGASPFAAHASAVTAQHTFKQALDAMIRIIKRAQDPDLAIRAIVSKICSEMWFLDGATLVAMDDETGSSADTVARPPEQRATDLADICFAMLRPARTSVALPVPSAHPLVAMLRSVLQDVRGARQGAHDVAVQLDKRILQLQSLEDQEDAQLQMLKCLLALHVLGVADPSLLLLDGADPQGLVRRLAPYLKKEANSHLLVPEQLTSIFAIIECVCKRLHHLSQGLATELAIDLENHTLKMQQVTGVAAACACLCAVLPLATIAQRAIVLGSIKKRFEMLQEEFSSGTTKLDRWRPRLLYLFGLLGRHGAVILAEGAAEGLCPSAEDVADLMMGWYKAPQADMKTRESALQALLLLFVARPDLAGTAEVLRVLSEALRPSAAVGLKLRCLGGLAELLRAEEDVLLARQLATKEDELNARLPSMLPSLPSTTHSTATHHTQRHSAAPTPSLSGARPSTSLTSSEGGERNSSNHSLGHGMDCAFLVAGSQSGPVGLPQGAASHALARRNGEGDGSSITSGLVQQVWPAVLVLTMDVTPATKAPPVGTPQTPTTAASAAGPGVRRAALDVVECVLRGGVVPPFQALPHLLQLSTDPDGGIAQRAQSQLQLQLKANSAFVINSIQQGLEKAFDFHQRLAAAALAGAFRRESLDPAASGGLLRSLCELWSGMLQPDNALKTAFLNALTKPLDDASSLVSHGADKSDPRFMVFMAHLLAELPYKKMDELLQVLHRLNAILSRRAAGAIEEVRSLQKALLAAQAALPGAASQPPTTAVTDSRTTAATANGSAVQPPNSAADGATAATAGGGAVTANGSASGGVAGGVTGRGPSAVAIAAGLKAGLSVSLMLAVKAYLRKAYEVATERLAQYDPTPAIRKVEEKHAAIKVTNDNFTVHYLNKLISLAVSTGGRSREASRYYAPEAARDKALVAASQQERETLGNGSLGQPGNAGQVVAVVSRSPTAKGEDASIGPEASAHSGQARSGTTQGIAISQRSGQQAVSSPAAGDKTAVFAALFEPYGLKEMAKTLKYLVDNDEADYKASLERMAGADTDMADGTDPATAAAVTAGSKGKPPKATRGGRGGAAGRGRGAGGAASIVGSTAAAGGVNSGRGGRSSAGSAAGGSRGGKGSGAKRRTRYVADGSDSEEESDDDDYSGSPVQKGKHASTRRRVE